MALASGRTPHFTPIADFASSHYNEIKDLFHKLLMICCKIGIENSLRHPLTIINFMCKERMSRLILTTAITALLILVISSSAQYVFTDGPSEKVVGFPFIWAMDGVNSLSITLFILGLLANFLIVFTLVFFIGELFLKIFSLRKRIRKYLVGAVSLVAVILWSCVLALNELHVSFELHSIFSSSIESVSIELFPFIG